MSVPETLLAVFCTWEQAGVMVSWRCGLRQAGREGCAQGWINSTTCGLPASSSPGRSRWSPLRPLPSFSISAALERANSRSACPPTTAASVAGEDSAPPRGSMWQPEALDEEGVREQSAVAAPQGPSANITVDGAWRASSSRTRERSRTPRSPCVVGVAAETVVVPESRWGVGGRGRRLPPSPGRTETTAGRAARSRPRWSTAPGASRGSGERHTSCLHCVLDQQLAKVFGLVRGMPNGEYGRHGRARRYRPSPRTPGSFHPRWWAISWRRVRSTWARSTSGSQPKSRTSVSW